MCGLGLFCWEVTYFLFTHSEAFPQVLLSIVLTGSSTCWNESFGFPEKGYNRGFPANPTIYTTSPSLDEDWHLVWLVIVQAQSLPLYIMVQYAVFITRNNLF